MSSGPASQAPGPGGPAVAVSIEGLTKVYRPSGKSAPKRALDGIDLAIPRGSLFALLGPNGAGKSTLINILAGLVIKTAGTVRIWGADLDRDTRAARRAIGVVPQELNIDPFFTPRELLDLQAGLYGVRKSERRTTELLELMGLADKGNAYARTLSGGMRRRLMVAKAMVHAPPILVLDEPTAGVDVELRRQLWANVKALNAAGTTVMLTTHYLEEAEELCDRIAIIDRGRLIASDTKAHILRRLDTKTLFVTVAEPLAALPAALAGSGIELAAPRGPIEGSTLVFRYKPGQADVAQVIERVRAAGLGVCDLTTAEPDLEDVFVALTSQAKAGTGGTPAAA